MKSFIEGRSFFDYTAPPASETNMAIPSEHRTIRGIEVVAVKHDGDVSCTSCPFHELKTGRCCDDVECITVIWMTPLTYITHRLTKGTTP